MKFNKHKQIKIISNAGGINLKSCRNAILEQGIKSGIELKIAIVEGDNLIDQEKYLPRKCVFAFSLLAFYQKYESTFPI